jgi:type I restriction enzyme S subunit
VTRLRFLAAVNPPTREFEHLDDNAEVTFVPLEDVWPSPRWAPKQWRQKAQVSSGYTRFREGDVLIPKITPTFEAGRSVVASDLPTLVAAGTTELHVVRPHAIDPRFANYCFQSKPFLDRGEATMVGVAGQKRVPELFLLDYDIAIDSAVVQCQIADFLDAETARIDALIEKRRRMIALLEERKTLLLPTALEVRGFRWGTSLHEPQVDGGLPPYWAVARLSVVLDQLTNGYVGPTRDVLVEEGVKYIQSLHIKDGKIDFTRGPYYVPPEWHQERPRIHLRPDDVLIVQTGDIGQVAVVPQNFGPASCHALQIARVRRHLLTGDYLGAYLRSPFGRQSLLCRVTGALHPHLEGGIRDIPVLLPPLDVQDAVVAEVRTESARLDQLRVNLLRQIDLLREHRRALITAAVTGQLDITKAAA